MCLVKTARSGKMIEEPAAHKDIIDSLNGAAVHFVMFCGFCLFHAGKQSYRCYDFFFFDDP